ncbi:bifunctional adenosylcobinamide kinase/adenosylcobinamide-phosphate guanylyltransferase [Notoacmeibacter sp. MSK16QG-6]|uniref:bifunctional adenosylcobinamide kinase/adenosylcobinamide-phosphate guanylyltransferase n=1 Tax=Notoacmeibacter sp. MSK16QG-6 TaxID=2957982 RepID=UPI00209D9704|nr:bifunctional adenosylcobinamide kinase/adenosylcobinamide-phosphate guanylyltransferase [Notoacmeibacter sp. MSK16QG-6]MCP1200433.1 bifunctional adenosylcobinamide kinase/adenosylcobinamide-phosphate guanylyltransferase [Notoacmeibacter sp. MSK16QG-6]
MTTGNITLVLGGARSGKSRYAEKLVTALSAPWTYIATAQAFDDEMKARIALHRSRRASDWETVEAPLRMAEALAEVPEDRPVLVDCLTLWLSNLILGELDVQAAIEALEKALNGRSGSTVLVSNEVGLSIVPDNALGRRFRDAQGELNQRIAQRADRVVFMAAGLPMILKPQ